MNQRQKVLVVGGGIAGVSTVSTLRANGYDGEIVLVDEAAFPYDRPPLSKDYLSGRRDLGQIALQRPDWYHEQRVELVASTEATVLRVATDEVEVEVADGRGWSADHVVLATGGRAIVPAVPGIEDARRDGFVHAIRTDADADGLRKALRPGADVLIVGGGLIGAEVASTARSLGADVVLVDAVDPPLGQAVGDDVAAWLHARHEDAGVEVLTTTLASVHEAGERVAVQLQGEPTVRVFDAVVVGVGMRPETALAEAAGLDVDGGVLVDDAQCTSRSPVLAVGDCARLRGERRAEHWEAGLVDGRRAAATILRKPLPARPASWWWSDRYGHHVEGVGITRATDDVTTVVRRGTLGEGPSTDFVVRAGRLVGAVAIDEPKAIRVARRLIESGARVDPSVLGDPRADLRKMLRS